MFFLGLVETHEGFHEQLGVFERFGAADFTDDMGEQLFKAFVDVIASLGIGHLGFHHLDEWREVPVLDEPFVGTLLEVGRGKLTVDGFRRVIEQKDRCKAGTSVPGNALFLVDVTYPEELFISS